MMNSNRTPHRDDRSFGGDRGREDQRRHDNEWDRGRRPLGGDPSQHRGYEAQGRGEYNPHRDEARDYRDLSFDSQSAGSYEQQQNRGFDQRQGRGIELSPRGYGPEREDERFDRGYAAQGRPSGEWDRDQNNRGRETQGRREFGGHDAQRRGYESQGYGRDDRGYDPVQRPRGDDWQSREQRSLARDYGPQRGYEAMNRTNPEFNRGYERANHDHEDDFRGGQPMGYRGQQGGYQGQHGGYQSREVDPQRGHQPERGYGHEQRGYDARRDDEYRGRRDFGGTYGPDRGDQQGRGGRDGIGQQQHQQFRGGERRDEFPGPDYQRHFEGPYAGQKHNGNGHASNGRGNGRNGSHNRH